MASREALGIMREKAHARLKAASTALMETRGLVASEYANLSKDPDVATVRTLEAIADDLEALVTAGDVVAPESTVEAHPEAVASEDTGEGAETPQEPATPQDGGHETDGQEGAGADEQVAAEPEADDLED